MQLTNGVVSVEVSTDFGPRVLAFCFVGEQNVFAEVPHLSTDTPLGTWKPYGGHRLWVAPEQLPGSYAPDDRPVDSQQLDALSASFRQHADAAGIEKQIVVRLAPDRPSVVVEHTIINRLFWPIRVAPWALTVVQSDGSVAIPQPPYRSHDEDLLPAQALVQWSFTDITDPRWSIGPRLIRLTPDPSRRQPQKIGLGNSQGWCALIRRRTVFVKRFSWDPDATYPDRGCNNEVYTDAAFLEIESLGPLRVLDPNRSATHVERWDLFRDIDVGTSEAVQAAVLRQLVDSLV